jgi:hypothetical protein
MKIQPRGLVLALMIAAYLDLTTLLVTAAAGNPQTLFTANTAATGATTAVTVME